jgi:DNA-directed RNA polymerase II subunit RPB1
VSLRTSSWVNKDILKKEAIVKDIKQEDVMDHFVKTEPDNDFMSTPHPDYTPDYAASGNTSEYSAMYSDWGGNGAVTPIPGEGGYGGGAASPTYYINSPSYIGSPAHETRTPLYRSSEHESAGSSHGAYSPGGVASPNYSPTNLVHNPTGYSPSGAMSPNQAASPSYQPYGGMMNPSSPGYSPTAARNYTHSSPQYSPTTANNYATSPNYSPTTPAYQSSISPRYSAGGSPDQSMGITPSSPIYNPTTPAYNYSSVKTEVKKEAKEESKEGEPKNYQPFIPEDD